MSNREELNASIDVVLQPLIEIFESDSPISCDDHGDFFTDLGWDVVLGDGRLINQAEETLERFVDYLPPMLRNWLWWQTPGGRVEARYIREALQSTPADYSALMTDESEARTDLIDALKQRMLRLAEQAYERYEENQYRDEGDD